MKLIPQGYKTFSWIAGVLVGVTTIPEIQALIAQNPVAAFWINNVALAALRWFTVRPVPLREKLSEKKEQYYKKTGRKFNTPPWRQKKGL